jgi:hypothetical protein
VLIWSHAGRLCETGDYVEYMSQSCKKSCADVGGSGGADGDDEVGEEEEEDKGDSCSAWAAQGWAHKS